FENLIISSRDGLKSRLGSGSVHNGCTGFLAEVQMSRNKICMEMRFEDIFQGYTILFQTVQVGLDFAQRIYYGSFTIRDYIVCTLCQTSGIYLFYFHIMFVFFVQCKFRFIYWIAM